MFSFHKPKIYRSLKGCCICRAKSSSSRFTDSKRYEADFEKCFWIEEERSGEICNACVLLVKRWKKLPAGSNRNWHHVVDARAGPGTKSIMKIKSRNKEERRIKKKHKHKKARVIRPPQSPGGLSDDVIVGDDLHSDHSSRSGVSSIEVSDNSDDDGVAPSPRKEQYAKKGRRKKQIKPTRFSSFLDLTYWKKTEICCGIIFKGPNGDVLLDTTLLHPCRTCKTPPRVASCPTSSHTPLTSEPAMTPQMLEGSSAPGSPMDAESASSLSISGTDSRSSSPPPPPQTVQTTVPSATSLAISTAVSAVLDLSMPVHKSTAINLTQLRCIEMEV